MTYAAHDVKIASLSDDQVVFLCAPPHRTCDPYEYFAPREWFLYAEPLIVGKMVTLLYDASTSNTFRLSIRPWGNVANPLVPRDAGVWRGVDLLKTNHVALTDTPPDPNCTVQDTLKQRGVRYGDFATGSALAVNLKRMIRAHANHAVLHAGHQQALDIIMDKVSRIINGDPMYADNWHDIAGYATLGEQLCTKD